MSDSLSKNAQMNSLSNQKNDCHLRMSYNMWLTEFDNQYHIPWPLKNVLVKRKDATHKQEKKIYAF